MSENKREKVRKMVQQVLDSSIAAMDSSGSATPVNGSSGNVLTAEFDRDESERELITEVDLKGIERGARVRVSDHAKFTPSAMDFIAEKEIQLVKKGTRGPELKVETVAIGADHGGFESKKILVDFLKAKGLRVRDLGTYSTEAVDYPDYAFAVAEAVSDGRVEAGIVIDGAGIGSAIAAGKVPGVRAAACYNVELAKNSREHNGANVLTLGSGQNSVSEMQAIVETFLMTEIEEPRHIKRVGKIEAIEKQFLNR